MNNKDHKENVTLKLKAYYERITKAGAKLNIDRTGGKIEEL